MSLSSATSREGWLVVGLERAAFLYLVLCLDSAVLAYCGRLSPMTFLSVSFVASKGTKALIENAGKQIRAFFALTF
jgi:hypothetical protein